MAYYFDEPSHTFSEYLLVPSYSSAACTPQNVSLKTPICKFRVGEQSPLNMSIPLVSAVMQSVSGEKLASALAREGGISFLFVSQPIESQANMVRAVKKSKSGFVKSDSNVTPSHTMADIMALKAKTGHSTVAVTEDGTPYGKLLGIVTSRDYRPSRMEPTTFVRDFMTPIDRLIYGREGISLTEANDIIWEHKLNALPIVARDGSMVCFVFRKDYEERVPALVEAGADVLCIDSSEGFTEWQAKTIAFIRSRYGDKVKVGAGNVVDADGFRYLADAGADFVKVGIGGGSICITREAKGIGRGQATAVQDVAAARDQYAKETGVYVPVCSDGGIVLDYHVTLALAMGADFCMLGRYFARCDESPTSKVLINGSYMKEYWGEGSARARNWQRYDSGGEAKLTFEEGVDSYVPYAGTLHHNVEQTLGKVRSTMCNCGALSIPELREKARLTLVSASTLAEGGAHDVLLKDRTYYRSFE